MPCNHARIPLDAAVATLLWLCCYGSVVNRGHHAATVPLCPVTTHMEPPCLVTHTWSQG